MSPDRIVSQELARHLTALTYETGRQVGVLVDRRGDVTHVMVGDSRGIEMPDWGRMRAGVGASSWPQGAPSSWTRSAR